jgi:hypothetical protein
MLKEKDEFCKCLRKFQESEQMTNECRSADDTENGWPVEKKKTT